MGSKGSKAHVVFSANKRGDGFDTSKWSPSSSNSASSSKKQKGSHSEQLQYIIENYSSFNHVFFGEQFDNVSEYDPTATTTKLPLELIQLILDYCDQEALQSVLKTCKFMYNLLRCDMYYWPQITKFSTFKQLTTYLESHDLCLYSEVYTNIGQALHYSDLLLPELTILRKTQFNLLDGNIENPEWIFNSQRYSSTSGCKSWEHPEYIGSTSALFSEKYIKHKLYDVDVLNLMLKTLFSLRKLVKDFTSSSSTPAHVLPNLRMAIRDYRNFFNSHPRLKFLLRVRENEDFTSNGPIELESREDELPKPIDNTLQAIAESDFGKPVSYSCLFCNSKISGFTCVKCNELLLIDSAEGTAKCPNCPCSIKRPKCCQKEMQAAPLGWLISPSTSGPHFNCRCSSITCRCFSCCTKEVHNNNNNTADGSTLVYNHYYQRVWSSDVYTCPSNGCKGTYCDCSFACNSCKESRFLCNESSSLCE